MNQQGSVCVGNKLHYFLCGPVTEWDLVSKYCVSLLRVTFLLGEGQGDKIAETIKMFNNIFPTFIDASLNNASIYVGLQPTHARAYGPLKGPSGPILRIL